MVVVYGQLWFITCGMKNTCKMQNKLKSKTRLLYIIPSLGSGGAERQLTYLLGRLPRDQYTAKVICFSTEVFYDLPPNVDVKFLVAPRSNPVLFIYSLWREIHSLHFDIIHGFLPHANLVAAVIGKMRRIPVITSVRSTNIPRIFAPLEKLVYLWSSRIIVNSQSIYRRLVDFGVASSKVHVIYNGIDTEAFQQRKVSQELARSTLGIELNETVCVMVGRVSLQKNHLCLLRSISHIHEKKLFDGQIKYYFFGKVDDDVLFSELKAFVAKNDLEQIVRFRQPVSDINLVYNAADFLVLPSLWEGTPNVLLEAMASSLPVIASNVDDNAVFVSHDSNGMLFESDNDEQLASCISNMIKLSKQAKSQFGANGYRVVEQYTIANMVNETLRHYEALLQTDWTSSQSGIEV